ncbi:MAG: type IX secretion system membrane protein PorP/SprF [Fulvivirga sp.]
MREFKYILILLAAVVTLNVNAQQQRPIQSLYMFDQLLINPAYAGTQVQFSATSIYRNQWVNLEGAPETFTFTAQSSVNRGKMGTGLIIHKDALGVHTDLGLYATGSYMLPMPVGKLYFGLQAGFNDVGSDFRKTTVPSAGTGANGGIDGASDPFYTATSAFNWNFGSGFFYTNREFYAGFSVPYLLDNDIIQDVEDDSFTGILSETIRNTRTYYLTLGNTYGFSPDFKIIASTLMRVQEGAPFSFDVNATGVFKETVGLGLSYRLKEGFVYLFELKINENFHVGYAYDMTVSALNTVSQGSHEFMLNYRIKIPRLHKGLECPSYF